MKSARESFATESLDVQTVEAVGKSRMHPRHRKLDALLKRS